MDLYERFSKLAQQLQIPKDQIYTWVEEKVREQKQEEKERRQDEKERRELAEKIRQEEKVAEKERRELEEKIRQQEREDRLLKERLDRDDRAAERQHSKATTPQYSSMKLPKIDCFVPDRDCVESFFIKFETILTEQGFPKDRYLTALMASLTGKALQIVTSTPDVEKTYDKVKRSILHAYKLTEEGYRHKFRKLEFQKTDDFDAFINRAQLTLEKWLEMAQAKDMESLKFTVLKEQLYNSCSPELAAFLKERNPNSLLKMKEYAGLYCHAHPNRPLGRASIEKPSYAGSAQRPELWHQQKYGNENRGRPRDRYNNDNWRRPSKGRYQDHNERYQDHNERYRDYNQQPRSQSYSRRNQSYQDRRGYNWYGRDQNARPQNTGYRNRYNSPTIRNQQRSGHDQRRRSHSTSGQHSCRRHNDAIARNRSPCRHCDRNLHSASEGHLCHQPTNHSQANRASCANEATSETVHTCSSCTLFGEAGHIELQTAKINNRPATLLRDTGCSTVIVRRSFVQDSDLTGETAKLGDIAGHIRTCDVACIYVETPYYTGYLNALVLEKPYADLTIGNITKIMDNKDTSKISNPKEEGDSQYKPFAQNATTRAASRRGDRPLKAPSPPEEIDRAKWIAAQRDDTTLKHLYEKIVGSHQSDHQQFFVESDLLCRRFHKKNQVTVQIVVPKYYRPHILLVSHDSLSSGHLGISATFKRIAAKFWWPKMRWDIHHYVKSCNICQLKAQRGRTTNVPLEPMPIIEKPFTFVAIDLVGPLPKSDRNHTHVLSFIDYSTRWPEAVPLKSTTTEHVAEALFSIITRLGLPEYCLSDNGSQFVSDVMSKTMELMGIKQKFSTPYHPQSNGVCERYHASLKAILKKVAHDQPREWDRLLPAVLFACREIPSETTGFSPFELTFGRKPRGPLSIVHDTLMHQEDNGPDYLYAYHYVKDLKERMEVACKLAQENTKINTERYREYADRKSQIRKFTVGDQVLVLLPKEKNKMLLTWKGPFQVRSVRSGVNYEISIGNRLKVYHANLLKKYIPRRDELSSIHNVHHAGSAIVIEDQNEESTLPTLPSKQHDHSQVDQVIMADDLDSVQRRQLRQLLNKYQSTLSDKPGQTDLVEHEIRLTSEEPIYTKPYAIPFHAREAVHRELESLLEMGVVRHSNSPYNSPIVVVKKKTGDIRLCIDFRRLNSKTLFDAEPIPNQDELFVNLSSAKYFSKLDLCKGYYQIPLKEEHKHYTAFQSPLGLLEFNSVPFGLSTAASSCQRLMRLLLQGIPNTVSYFDDVCVYSDSWDEHLLTLEAVLESLRVNGVTVKPSKMFVGFPKIEFLGHTVCKGFQTPENAKLTKIKNLQPPTTKKETRKILGLLNFYRKYVDNFAAIAAPLTNLTKNNQPNKVKWTEDCQRSLDRISDILCSEPVLAIPNLEKSFVLRTDASDKGIAGVLLQERDGTLLPCSYVSRKLSETECRYSVIERECLAIVFAIKTFSKFLLLKEFQLQTDHQPLTYLKSNRYNNSRLLRWSLLLQDYSFTVSHISGKDNIHADFLSRSP